MTITAVSNKQQIHSFAHFFPEKSRRNATTQLFIQTLLPLINQLSKSSFSVLEATAKSSSNGALNTLWDDQRKRICFAVNGFKNEVKPEVFQEFIAATQRYLRSPDCPLPGRYENKIENRFLSALGVQYFAETSRLQKLCKELNDLPTKVKPSKPSWSQNFRACWNGFFDYCSSTVTSTASYVYNNPGKAACGLLALEAAVLTVRSHRHHTTVMHEFTEQFSLACSPNLMMGLTGTLLTQNRLYFATAGIFCLPIASGQNVNGQISDQLLNIGGPFYLDINTTDLFSEPVTDITASQVGGGALPSWLATVVGNSPMASAHIAVVIKDNLAYVTDFNEGLKIIDLSDLRSVGLRDNNHPYPEGICDSNDPSLREAPSDNYTCVAEYNSPKYGPLLNKLIPHQVANIYHTFQFTLAPNTFIHNDGYHLTYTACQDNFDPLPLWLNFDEETRTFRGIPQERDKGSLTVAIKANDNFQGQATGVFDLVVEHFPRLVKNFPTIYGAFGHGFSFATSSYFIDEDGETLQFSASSEGEVLPKSLVFDKEGKFSGTLQLSDKKVIPITLTSMDPSGGKVTAIFNISLCDYAKAIASSNPPEVIIDNRSPQLIEPLLGQTLSAGVPSDFSVKSSFEDPDGDQLLFRAADLDGAENWLTLDPVTGHFSGTPSSSDAATFATRRYTIGVTATDPANKTAAGSFDILLQGPSLTEKIINACLLISGFAVAARGYYQKKYLLWNWCRKKKYQQPDWNIAVGQTGLTHQVSYPANEIKQINVIRIKDRCCLSKDRCCFDIRKNTEERTPPDSARAYLFDWLLYDLENNRFQVVKKGPDASYSRENIQIQIRGTDNRIMEQFTIRVGDDATDPRELSVREIQESGGDNARIRR